MFLFLFYSLLLARYSDSFQINRDRRTLAKSPFGHNIELKRSLLLSLSSKPFGVGNEEKQTEHSDLESSSNDFGTSTTSSSLLLESLRTQKDQAVEEEDYLRAAILKQQIDDLLSILPQEKRCESLSQPKQRQSTAAEQEQGIIQHWESAFPLNAGDNLQFPPMWEVPCSIIVTGNVLKSNINGNNDDKAGQQMLNDMSDPTFKLTKLIKPPNTDILWQWYETRGDMQADPSWAEVWPAASSLAATLVRECAPTRTIKSVPPSQLSIMNKTVIELGCGLGIAGLTAAGLGATRVVLMDREPYALHCAMATANINGMATDPTASVPAVVEAAVIDWSGFEDAKATASSKSTEGSVFEKYKSSADVILCSDVLYDFQTVEDLAHVIRLLLRKREKVDGMEDGRLVLVTDPAIERVQGIQQEFCRVLRDLGAKDVGIRLLPPTPSSKLGGGNIGRMSERTVLIQARW